MQFVLCILKHVRQILYSDVTEFSNPECFMFHPFDLENIGYSCQSFGIDTPSIKKIMRLVKGFKGYGIFCILLPGIWNTVFHILVTFREFEYLVKLIMGEFAGL